MSANVNSGLFQRLLLIGFATALAMARQFALNATVGQLIFMTLCVIVLMVPTITFRAERRLPLLCDPFVIVLAFMAQFYVIGAPALFLLDFNVSRPVSPERGVLILGLFSLLIASFFLGYQMRLGTIVADLLPDFEGGRRRMSWVWVETVIVGAGVAGCLALIVTQGGVAKMIRAGYGQSKEGPIFQLAYHTLLAGTFLMAWRVRDHKRPNP